MKALFFILLLFIQPLAMASWTSGNELNNNLNEEPGYSSGFALGFISGVASVEADSSLGIAKALKTVAEDKSIKQSEKRERVLGMFDMVKNHYVCIPNNVTLGQLSAIVKKWLALNPERWNESAAALVKDALLNSFPCKNLEDLWK